MNVKVLGISASQGLGNTDVLVKESLKVGRELGNVENRPHFLQG